MAGKLTKARKAALVFVRDNEPVKLFPIGGPSLSLVKKMTLEGFFIEERPGAFEFIRYSLSQSGRLALSEGKETGK